MRRGAFYFCVGGFLTVVVLLLGALLLGLAVTEVQEDELVLPGSILEPTKHDPLISFDGPDALAIDWSYEMPEVLATFGPDTLTIGSSVEISLDTGEVVLLKEISIASEDVWKVFQSYFMERVLRMTDEELWSRLETKVAPIKGDFIFYSDPGPTYADLIFEGHPYDYEKGVPE